MNKERLNKLADFLDTLNVAQFKFHMIARHVPKDDQITCGTIGCAIGFTPVVFPELVEYRKRYIESSTNDDLEVRMIGSTDNVTYIRTAMRLFDMEQVDASLLFTPDTSCPWNVNRLYGSAKPQEVAASIRKFIEWKRQ